MPPTTLPNSGVITAPCSIRSPGPAPAASQAAIASANAARVTQCTATGRRYAWATSIQPTRSSKGGGVWSSSTIFTGPTSSGSGNRCRRQRRAARDRDPLRQRTAANRGDQRPQVVDAVVRRRVGDARDPEAGQPSPDRAEIRHTVAREHISQPSVEPEQPSCRTTRAVALDAVRRPGRGGPLDGIEGGRVEDPHRTAAVLHPHRAMRHDGVEELSVERPATDSW